MSHFAKVEDGVVTDVIVAEQDFIDALDDSALWVQTSYNTRRGVHHDPETGEPDGGEALRKNYAGIGSLYDGIGFCEPQPYASWTLDSDTYVWNPPTPSPFVTEEQFSEGYFYDWDEDAYQQDNSTGWVLKQLSE